MSLHALKSSSVVGFDTSRVSQSVRMNGTDEYFTRANTSHSTNRAIGIISYRLEDDDTGSKGLIGIGSGGTGSTNAGLYITNNTLTLYVNGTGYSGPVVRNNEWNHAVVSFDLSEASAADKGKVYHRGELVIENGKDSSFGSTTNAYAGQIFTGNRFPGKMAQITWLDGVSIQNGDYAITDFGDFLTAGDNGTIFAPKSDADMAAIAAAVGGNSYCLTDQIGDGVDASGNGNTVTATGMTHAANGSDDTPSFNLNVLNHLTQPSTTMVLNKSGHGFQVTGSSQVTTTTEVRASGKWNQEFIMTQSGSGSAGYVGACPPIDVILNASFTGSTATQGHFWVGLTAFDDIFHNGTMTHYGLGYSSGDRINILLDLDNGWLFWGKNGQLYDASGNPHSDTTDSTNAIVTGLTGDWAFAVGGSASGDTPSGEVVEPDDFSHTFSGFEAMTSANRPDPQYQGADWFNTVLFTGDNTSDRYISGVGFQPGIVWTKNYGATSSNRLFDKVRGVGTSIITDTAAAEGSETGLASFEADGYDITHDGGNAFNQTGGNYLGHCWQLDGGANPAVATPGHLSIITRTGNATDNTAVAHGLPDAPELVIAKNRSDAASWNAWHIALAGATSVMDFNNGTTAATNAQKFGGTDAAFPDATNFYVGTNNESNGSGDDMIYYCFRSVPGVCKVGVYESNNNADGPYGYCGFRPRWIMFKANSNWVIFDTARSTINPVTNGLYVDTDTAEVSFASGGLDITADGFKHRQTSGQLNTTAGTSTLFVAMADVVGGGPNLPPILGR